MRVSHMYTYAHRVAYPWASSVKSNAKRAQNISSPSPSTFSIAFAYSKERNDTQNKKI